LGKTKNESSKALVPACLDASLDSCGASAEGGKLRIPPWVSRKEREELAGSRTDQVRKPLGPYRGHPRKLPPENNVIFFDYSIDFACFMPPAARLNKKNRQALANKGGKNFLRERYVTIFQDVVY
jgi:hypothetical protein